MGFPTTPVLDTFTGVDGTTPPNANWTNETNQIKILSNQADGVDNLGNLNIAAWTARTFGSDIEVYCTISVRDTTTVGDNVQVQGVNQATGNGYSVEFDVGVGNDTIKINRFDASVKTSLVTTTLTTGANGDKFGMSRIGKTITAWYKSGSGAWLNVLQAIDSTYIGVVNISILIASTGGTAQLDDFGGGNYSPKMPLASCQNGTRIGSRQAHKTWL